MERTGLLYCKPTSVLRIPEQSFSQRGKHSEVPMVLNTKYMLGKRKDCSYPLNAKVIVVADI